MAWFAWKRAMTGPYLVVYFEEEEVKVDRANKVEFLMQPKVLPHEHEHLPIKELEKLYPLPTEQK